MSKSDFDIKKAVLLFSAVCLLAVTASAMYYRGKLAAKPQVVRERKMPMTMGDKGSGKIMSLMQELQKNPQDLALLTRLGQAFMSMNAWDRAAVFWKKVLALPGQEKNIMALMQLGTCYFEKKQNEKSLEVFEKLIALEPTYAPAYFNLGLLYKYRLKKPEAAKKAFSKIISLQTKEPGLLERAKRELKTLP